MGNPPSKDNQKKKERKMQDCYIACRLVYMCGLVHKDFKFEFYKYRSLLLVKELYYLILGQLDLQCIN